MQTRGIQAPENKKLWYFRREAYFCAQFRWFHRISSCAEFAVRGLCCFWMCSKISCPYRVRKFLEEAGARGYADDPKRSLEKGQRKN